MPGVVLSERNSSASSKWLSRLSGPWGFRAVILAAALLALPSLFVGFFLDDYAHLEAADGISPVASPWNLYCFAPGDPELTARLIDTGPFPWFTDLNLRVRFFRPLSSATMVLDRRLFGDASWGYHLQSVLWYLALLLVIGRLLKRALPGSLALLTLALFAVAESHWFPVVWWAHRNTLVAATLGFVGLLAYVRWREDGWKPGLPLACLGLGLGLLGGEVALSIFGYVIAYELFAAPGAAGALSVRLRALLPIFALGFVYLAGYILGGYGVSGTGCYFSPLSNPLTYLRHAPERFLILAGNQFFLIPAEIAAFDLRAVLPLACAGTVALAIVGAALREAWPRLEQQERRGVRWLAIGALLASPPFLAPFTSGRLLVVVSLGGLAVIAAIIRDGWRLRATHNALRASDFAHRKKLAALAWVLIVLHLVVAPIAWLGLTFGFRALNNRVLRLTDTMELDDSRVASQQMMMFNNAPSPVLAIYGVAVRTRLGHPRPAAWRPLTLASLDETLKRVGPCEFELELQNGKEMFKTLPELIARDPRNRLRPGETLRFRDFDVEILDVGKVGPTRMAFRFRAPLEDPRYVWLAWRDGALRQFHPPPVGETINLPSAFLR
jgi:hypothetical protein